MRYPFQDVYASEKWRQFHICFLPPLKFWELGRISAVVRGLFKDFLSFPFDNSLFTALFVKDPSLGLCTVALNISFLCRLPCLP